MLELVHIRVYVVIALYTLSCLDSNLLQLIILFPGYTQILDLQPKRKQTEKFQAIYKFDLKTGDLQEVNFMVCMVWHVLNKLINK